MEQDISAVNQMPIELKLALILAIIPMLFGLLLTFMDKANYSTGLNLMVHTQL